MVLIKNWRAVQPNIAHLSAVHWGGLRRSEQPNDPDERNCLQRLEGFPLLVLHGDAHAHRVKPGLPSLSRKAGIPA